jgi:hypothetical protein
MRYRPGPTAGALSFCIGQWNCFLESEFHTLRRGIATAVKEFA